jgi:hypothetical protein
MGPFLIIVLTILQRFTVKLQLNTPPTEIHCFGGTALRCDKRQIDYPNVARLSKPDWYSLLPTPRRNAVLCRFCQPFPGLELNLIDSLVADAEVP